MHGVPQKRAHGSAASMIQRIEVSGAEAGVALHRSMQQSISHLARVGACLCSVIRERMARCMSGWPSRRLRNDAPTSACRAD
ncbi:UNVERIFIED_CONTAM: hypothetical protein EX528_03925 [Xanthomonas axonopodis]